MDATKLFGLAARQMDAVKEALGPSWLPAATPTKLYADYVADIRKQITSTDYASHATFAAAVERMRLEMQDPMHAMRLPKLQDFTLSLVEEQSAWLKKVAAYPTFEIGQLDFHAQVLSSPSFQIQEAVRYAFELAALSNGDDADPEGAIAPNQGASELRISDSVTATLHAPLAVQEASWWSGLSHDARTTILITVIFNLISWSLQLPGTVKDTRDLMGLDADQASAQIQTIAEVKLSSQRTLERLAELELQTAKQHTESSHNQELIARSLQLFVRELPGRVCKVRNATPLRELRPGGEVMLHLPAQLPVLCIAHEGKWLEVIYDGPDGKLRGWVLKKHLQWD